MLLELVGADAERARQDAWVGEIVQWVAQVDDEGRRCAGLFGVVEHLLKFGGLETHLAYLLEELALLPDAVGEEAKDHRSKDEEGEVAEPCKERRAFFSEVAEETAGEYEGFAPDDGAGEIPCEETRVGHAGLAGDGRGDGAEAGDELCEEQCDRTTAGEVALGLADAGGGFEGEAAEKLEDAVAVAAAEGEPDGVGDDAGEEHRDGDADEADAMGRTECACSEKDRNAGDGDADLFHENPEEDDQVRVMDEKYDRDRHGSLLSYR